jgi:hypothetical protein
MEQTQKLPLTIERLMAGCVSVHQATLYAKDLVASAYLILPGLGGTRVMHQYGGQCLMKHFDQRGCTLIDLSRVDVKLTEDLNQNMGCHLGCSTLDERPDKKAVTRLIEILSSAGLSLIAVEGEALIKILVEGHEAFIATCNCD